MVELSAYTDYQRLVAMALRIGGQQVCNLGLDPKWLQERATGLATRTSECIDEIHRRELRAMDCDIGC